MLYRSWLNHLVIYCRVCESFLWWWKGTASGWKSQYLRKRKLLFWWQQIVSFVYKNLLLNNCAYDNDHLVEKCNIFTSIRTIHWIDCSRYWKRIKVKLWNLFVVTFEINYVFCKLALGLMLTLIDTNTM